jgi:hypothetical protein
MIMEPINQPEPTNQQLLAYLDGEADTTTIATIEGSRSARQRLEGLARLTGKLTARLYRVVCPQPNELGEFQLALLPEHQQAAIQEHLTTCPHCQAELTQLQGYLADLAADIEPSLAERIHTIIAQFVRGTLGAGNLGTALPALAPLGIRGAISEPLVYQAEEQQIVIDLEEAASGQPELRDMLILLTGQTLQIATIQLYQDETLLAETSVDQAGNALLTDIASGEYTMRIQSTQQEILIPALRIG